MRLRFRYSLKVFLLVWLLIGLGLGWFGIHWQQASRQAAAVKAIQFGLVNYDYQRRFDDHLSLVPSVDSDGCEYRYWNDRPLMLSRSLSTPAEPAWLLDILDIDFFHSITSYNHLQWLYRVDVVEPPLTAGLDREMDQLVAFPRLREFSLIPYQIDVPQLMQSNLFVHLGKLKELEFLELKGLPLEAEHLSTLQNHPKLRVISLRSAEMNDEALAALGTLPALQSLDLQYCEEIGQTGLPVLGNWKQLRMALLSGTACDDRLATQLAKLTQLEVLDLNSTSIGMETLQTLRKLPRLRRLNLCGLQFTDAQLAEVFQGWSNLETLDLSHTNAGEQFASICPSLTGLRYLNLEKTPLAPEAALAVPIDLPRTDCKLEIGTAYHGSDPFAEEADAESDSESSDPFAEEADANRAQEASSPF